MEFFKHMIGLSFYSGTRLAISKFEENKPLLRRTMRVVDAMTPNPECIHSDEPIRNALGKLLELGVRHLPVVDNGKLTGILSDRDIRDYAMPLVGEESSASMADPRIRLNGKVCEIMTANVIAVDPDSDIKEAVELMLENRISALPVLEPNESRLVGILTTADVLKAAKDHL